MTELYYCDFCQKIFFLSEYLKSNNCDECGQELISNKSDDFFKSAYNYYDRVNGINKTGKIAKVNASYFVDLIILEYEKFLLTNAIKGL